MGDKEDCLLNRIRRDGWREYLSNAGTSDTTEIYKMIRRRGGRVDSVFVHPCAAPLLQDGTYYNRPKDTREELELFFEQRLTGRKEESVMGFMAPGRWSVGNNKQGKQEKRRKIVGRDGVIRGKFVDFQEVEIRREVNSISPDEAPAAGTVLATAYQNWRSLMPVITQSINTMVRWGRIPKSLLEVIVVPLAEPGKCPHACESKRPFSLINSTGSGGVGRR